jgi:PAS domain S-box-containing protein
VGELGIGRDITERKRAETALGMLMSEQKSIMETIPDIVFVLDLNGNLVKWNSSLEKVTGYSSEELLGKPTVDFFDKEYQPVIAQAIRKAFEKGYNEVESPLRRKDGTTIPYLWNGAVLRDGKGSVIGITGVGRDLTERKRAEEALEEKARINQILVDALPCVALLLHSGTREVVISNEAAVRVGAVPGTQCYATLAQRETPCPWCLASDLWATGKAQHLEVEALGIVWDAHWLPVSEDLYMHYAFDITERKLAEKASKRVEEALRASEAKYRDLIERAWDAIFVADRYGTILLANTKACELLGCEREEALKMNIADTYRAEEREVVGERIARAEKGEHWRYERAFVRKDGAVLPVEVTIGSLPDGTIQGIMRDITERRQAEGEIKRKTEDLFLSDSLNAAANEQ